MIRLRRRAGALEAPVTSISLLRDLAKGSDAPRWKEFFDQYEPVMRGFLDGVFPGVDADDVIQETFLVLLKVLPGYRYVPDKKGHFRNYVIGVVKHKALDVLRRTSAQNKLKSTLPVPEEEYEEFERRDEEEWRRSVKEAALEQVLADDSVSSRNREVFRHVVLMHESPESVARQFGITRNNVDQIKSRMIERLGSLVKAMIESKSGPMR